MKTRIWFVVWLLLVTIPNPVFGQGRDSIPPVSTPGDTLAPQKAEDVKTGARFQEKEQAKRYDEGADVLSSRQDLVPGRGNRSISGLPCITLTSRNRWYHDTVAPASVSDTSVVYALDGSMLVPFSDTRFPRTIDSAESTS